MKQHRIQEFKAKTKKLVPIVAASAAIGATVTAIYYHRKYYPTDQIAMQFPKGVLAKMKDEGLDLVINSNQGYFTLKYHPSN